jgi:hypothetical protein
MDPAPTYGPKECGSCRLWRPILEDARGAVGPCRLQVRTGDFPGTAPACDRRLARDEAVPSAPPLEARRRRAVSVHAASPVLVRAGAAAHLPPGVAPRDDVPLPEEILDMTREDLAELLRELIREEGEPVPLAAKWEGGTMVLKPRDAALQPKEIPLDALFHKVVMLRDRLRVLEQKVNAHDKLSDAEKVELQGYVTKCYGSLTTFNVLFRDEKDRFIGEKGERG